MRDGETLDAHVADVEDGAGLEFLHVRSGAGLPFAPVDGGGGELRQIDRNAKRAGEHAEAANVVAVFMGDDDGVERFGIDTDGGEALKGFPLAEPCVNEDARMLATDVGA